MAISRLQLHVEQMNGVFHLNVVDHNRPQALVSTLPCLPHTDAEKNLKAVISLVELIGFLHLQITLSDLFLGTESFTTIHALGETDEVAGHLAAIKCISKLLVGEYLAGMGGRLRLPA